MALVQAVHAVAEEQVVQLAEQVTHALVRVLRKEAEGQEETQVMDVAVATW